jgi:hypothetical protein
MAHRSMVRRSSATGRESTTCSCFDGYLFLFRRSPRQAGTVRPRLTSKTVWTCRRTQPRRSRGHRGDRPCPMATLARQLSHRTAAAPCRTRHREPIGGAYTTPPHWRQTQVIWPPEHEHGWRPASARFGPSWWPRGHRSGGRTIQRPSVQRTRAPTAGITPRLGPNVSG